MENLDLFSVITLVVVYSMAIVLTVVRFVTYKEPIKKTKNYKEEFYNE